MIIINVFESIFAVVFLMAVITSLFIIPNQLSTKDYLLINHGQKDGCNDTLEWVVHRVGEISPMKSCEKREVILEYLAASEDKEVSHRKACCMGCYAEHSKADKEND